MAMNIFVLFLENDILSETKGYILLLAHPLYHYVVSLFVSYYSLCFKVYFVRYK